MGRRREPPKKTLQLVKEAKKTEGLEPTYKGLKVKGVESIEVKPFSLRLGLMALMSIGNYFWMCKFQKVYYFLSGY